MLVSKNISAKEARVLSDAEVLTPTAQTTTNSYADLVGSTIDTANYRSIAMVLRNTHVANDIDWKVLGSIDGITWVEVQAEATIQQESFGSYSATVAVWRYYKIQVKATSGGNQGTALAHIIAK